MDGWMDMEWVGAGWMDEWKSDGRIDTGWMNTD